DLTAALSTRAACRVRMVTKLATAAHAYALSCQKEAHIARRRYVTCWGVIAGHLSFDLSTASGKLMAPGAQMRFQCFSGARSCSGYSRHTHLRGRIRLRQPVARRASPSKHP